ncbi:MAG: hypothetical protein QJR03_05945 [Sphaerobacter sp.]|nr:hypothetical protein [Sphaerobacter sp.]
MADDLDRLLRYIVNHYIAQEELKDVERDATSVGDLAASQRRALREEEQRVEALAGPFREGLLRARAARQAGGNAISLDDRDPLENLIADAMIHFLVSPGMATSTTRETEPMHYIYTIAVDWERLLGVARQARVDLDAAIPHASP